MPPTVQARRATLADAPATATLFDAYRIFYGQQSDLPAAEAFTYARLEQQESVVLLAERPCASEPIGFVQLYPTFSSITLSRRWSLNDLFVGPATRGLGVGRLLLSSARDFAAANGAAGLQLETATDNVAARSLYESLGWKLQEGFCAYALSV